MHLCLEPIGHSLCSPMSRRSRSPGVTKVGYRALAQELRTAILSGDFGPDHQLPTEAELTVARGVSRQTVRLAYAQLVAESLVYRVPGRGSFVSPSAAEGAYLRSFRSVEDLLALSADTEMEVVEALEWRADVAAAGRLQL